MSPTHQQGSEDRAAEKGARWRLLLACALPLGVCLATSTTFAPQIDGRDAVDFAFALDNFDLHANQPHFPGYPVFVGVAKLLELLGVGPAMALALPGFVGMGLLVALGPASGRAPRVMLPAWMLGMLLHPIWLVDGLRAMSDGLAMVLWAGLLWFALGDGVWSRRRAVGLGLLGGILVGVRPPALVLLPVFLFAAWRAGWLGHRGARRFIAGAGVGIGLWLVPLVALHGAALWEVGPGFLAGHFANWGGGALATELTLADRAGHLIRGAWALAGGVLPGEPVLWGAFGVLLAGALAGLRWTPPSRRSVNVFAGWALVLTAAWWSVGTNVERPRHLLPLVPLLAMLAAIGVEGWRLRLRAVPSTWVPTLGALALLALAVAGGLSLRLQTQRPPTVYEAATIIAERYGADGTELITDDATRLLSWLTPSLRTTRAHRLDEGLASIDARRMRPRVILWLTRPRAFERARLSRGGALVRVAEVSRSWRLAGPDAHLVLAVYEPTGVGAGSLARVLDGHAQPDSRTRVMTDE